MNRNETTDQKEIEKIKEELTRYQAEGAGFCKELREYMQGSSKWFDTKAMQ